MDVRTVENVLHKVAGALAAVGFPEAVSERLRLLAQSVQEPCVVAVVGRVKAGKSSFVNALLGADLAKVGATETTATINRFVYGAIDIDTEKPIRCVWESGEVTSETARFLSDLQGNDETTLRKAAGIAYLEYRLPSPFLERVTLVDTPGLAAVVDEHQDRAATFLGLKGELRNRNIAATQRLEANADAIIYVVGEVARTGDQAFLEEFQNVTGGRSGVRNALGVVAKIDRTPELMRRRQELSQKMAQQLSGAIDTIVPVSASIQRVLQETSPAVFADLARLATQTPPELCDLLLTSDELFTTLELPECPVSPADRARLLGNTPWTTFVATVNALREFHGNIDAARQKLNEIAGFDTLTDLLRRRFLERGSLLRAFRIVAEAQTALSDLRYQTLPEIKKRCRAESTKYQRFAQWVRTANPAGDATAEELLQLLRGESERAADRSLRCEVALRDVTRQLDTIYSTLQSVQEDYDALELVQEAVQKQMVAPTEAEELRRLFGAQGSTFAERVGLSERSAHAESYIEKRARYFAGAAVAASEPYQTLCEQARNRYECLLDDLITAQQFLP